MTSLDDRAARAGRWAWAEIDVGAVAHNVAVIRSAVAPSGVWAVVKADGYGHGMVPVAEAALAAGADGLCVALLSEAATLRDAGVDCPVLVLSEQPEQFADEAIRLGVIATVYRAGAVVALGAAARRAGAVVEVHVKLDTGMQRVGATPDRLSELVDVIRAEEPALMLGGVFTHLAVADEPGDSFTAHQLGVLDEALNVVDLDDSVVIHSANSAGALAHDAARRAFVRAGIAMYGISPGPGVDHLASDLRPAMTLRARVSLVKRVRAGSRISYGLRHTFAADSTVATVPIGYADGVSRRLASAGGEVLVGGVRRPVVGVVTMDQLMVDCGDDEVSIGDDVVLIGEQSGPNGSDSITAAEVGSRLGTIGYEVVCAVSARVPRLVVGR